MNDRKFRMLLGSALVLALPGVLLAQEADSSANRRSVELFYSKALQHHPAPFNRHPQPELEAAFQSLLETAESLNEAELFVALSRFTGMFADGHTYVWLYDDSPHFNRSVPLRFWQFADGIFIRAASPEYAQLIGGRVVAVGEVPIDKAWHRLEASRPGENESSASRAAAVLLQIPEWLRVLGLADGDAEGSYLVQLANGDLEEVSVNAEQLASFSEVWSSSIGLQLPDDWVEAQGVSEALWMSRRAAPFWRTRLEDPNVLYLQVNASRRSLDAEDRSRDDWTPFVDAVAEELAKSPPSRLIIDLRHNRGGDSSMWQPLVHALIADAKVNQPGKLFVLTSRLTESAAVAMAARLEHETNALFAGEAPSSRPNFYNDPRPGWERDVYTVPESRINFRVSRIVEQWSAPQDFRRTILPDLPVDLTYSDFAAGEDAVLGAVLAFDGETAADSLVDSEGEQLTEPWSHFWRASQDPAWPEEPYGHLLD